MTLTNYDVPDNLNFTRYAAIAATRWESTACCQSDRIDERIKAAAISCKSTEVI
ncbi:hypothetical protein ACN4EK_09015 [Pantanalinema rosaneae CENA516]|uniref:hypothetical protein n=1 Tax=Pantanalinema rosaneae TaxID=1620701 RepID=UPI003D6E6773